MATTQSKSKRCGCCGAELWRGVAECPLCGNDPEHEESWSPSGDEVGVYQSNVRKLKAELLRLRKGDAEAV